MSNMRGNQLFFVRLGGDQKSGWKLTGEGKLQKKGCQRSPRKVAAPSVQEALAEQKGSNGLVHCCTIFLCCWDDEIDDHHRNPITNNGDHLVG